MPRRTWIPQLGSASLTSAIQSPDRERRSHGPLRVVAVRLGRAEEPADRVADELLHRPAEADELRANALVVRRERVADVFGIDGLGARGRSDDVAEERRDDLALVLARGRLAWSSTAPHAPQNRNPAGLSNPQC